MSKYVLELKNVSKYFGKNKIIDNITLQVEEGEIFGFLGPNGAGKTTTIKMILGLLSIDDGTISVNGYNVKKEFEKAMTYIGGIVENPDTYDYMSGLDNLKLHARIRKVSMDRVNEVVKMVGLENRIKEKVSKYSLGMKQRLGLALTLLHSPKVLILDEPTNGLDPAGIKDLRNILKKIAKEDKTAVFVSSHILSEMQEMCDRVAVLNKGKIEKIETIDEVINEQDEEVTEYTLETNNIEKSINLIKEEFNMDVLSTDDKIHLNISRDDVAKLVKILVKNDVDIYMVNRRSKSLEDTFFNITKKEVKDK